MYGEFHFRVVCPSNLCPLEIFEILDKVTPGIYVASVVPEK